MNDILRAGVAVPKLKIADPTFNANLIREKIKEARAAGVRVLTFPELSLTGYTCGDLFASGFLLERATQALCKLAADIPEDILVAVGAPLEQNGRLYNCAFLLSGGNILGAVPKTFLPTYGEYYERRWFSPAPDGLSRVALGAFSFPFGTDLIFAAPDGTKVGVEICEDLWSPLPPSSLLSMAGAEVILNLSASNETILKRNYRRDLILQQSARTFSAYLYASAGSDESTSDLIFSGHGLIALAGSPVAENRHYIDSDYLLYTDLDLEKIRYDRRHNRTFGESAARFLREDDYESVPLPCPLAVSDGSLLSPGRLPFVPDSKNERVERCMQIFDMQASALSRRLSITGGKLTVGISGGLDSTLALLVAIKAVEKLHLPRKNIIAVTMPCFGTSDETLHNATELMEKLGVDARTVPIGEAVRLHFRDIGQSETDYSVTYENCQARERTQVLMDIANKEGGIVLGTGDLSELALGWCTYNGDHMSMYAVNAGVPKTLVRWIISGVADSDLLPEATAVLYRIIDTPISPELLPPDAVGKISQKTEDIVGPYALHDFFLYYTLRYQFRPRKIYELSRMAFGDLFDDETTKKWLKVFFRRFFGQQFKRNCMPDSVKIGSVCLSPRGDWRMPADASAGEWLAEAETL